MAHKGNIKGTRKDLLLQRRWIVPTLQSAPTTSTWAWNDNGITVYFRIGNQVRVEDTEQSSGYQFWKLYDIKPNGDRIWAPINSCAVALHIFKVIENNYDSPKHATGAIITISCDTDDRNLTFAWNGQNVEYVLKPNSTYTVTPGSVPYYQTPSSFTIQTGSSDAGTYTHQIIYNHQRENVNIRLSKTNDTDITSVVVSTISKKGTLTRKSLSTTAIHFTSFGYIPFGTSYYIRLAGSTFCWSGTLFGAYETTLREASSSTYVISLPFTDDRIDVVFKHTTSNGEVFFDPEDVVGYENKNIQIIFIATSGSTYEGDEIKENLCPHSYGSPYLSRITAISSDPRNTASLQYNISKYLLPGNYVIKCTSDFAVTSNTYYNMGSYTKIQNQFYQLQSPITKEVTENDNVIEFTWKLIYCYLSAQSRDILTSTIRVRKTNSGATYDVTKNASDGFANIGMVDVPGNYRVQFADIPYTYRGVDTVRTCEDSIISLDPNTTSKRYKVISNEYYYGRTYKCMATSASVNSNVSFTVNTEVLEFDLNGYGTSCRIKGPGEYGSYKWNNPHHYDYPDIFDAFIYINAKCEHTTSTGGKVKTTYEFKIGLSDINGVWDSVAQVYSRISSKTFTVDYSGNNLYVDCIIKEITVSPKHVNWAHVNTDEFGYKYRCTIMNDQSNVILYQA